MSTEIASLLATAEVETSGAEKDLDNLSNKFDQTAKRVEGVGTNLRSTKTALDQTGGSARAVHKDFENLTTNGKRGIEALSSTTRSFLSTLSSQIPGVGAIASSLGRDFLRSSNQIANEADRLRDKLKSLESQAARVQQQFSNRTSDFTKGLDIKYGGKIDTSFLQQFGSESDAAKKTEMLMSKGLSSEFTAEIDRAALKFSQLERNGAQALAAIEAKSTTTRAELATLEAQAGTTGGAFARLGPIALGAFLAVGAGAAALVVHTANVGDEIYRVAAKTRFTAETLSVLRIEAKEAGNNFNEFSTALPRFERNVAQAAEGNKKFIATFDELGIKVGKGANAEEIFKQFLTGFSQIEDESKRAEIAIQLFGRSGANLIPTFDRIGANFEETAAHARALGAVMGRDAVQAAHDFELKMRDAKLGLEGLMLTVGNAALPVLTVFIDLIVKLAPALFAAGGTFAALTLGSKVLVPALAAVTAETFSLTAAIDTLLGSLGPIGWISILIGATVALFSFADAQREVNVLSNDTISLTKSRIEQTQQEIDAISRRSATTKAEAEARERDLVIKREELRINQELAQTQELGAIAAMINALKNLKDAREAANAAAKPQDVTSQEGMMSQPVDLDKLQKANEKYSETDTVAKRAATALDFMSRASNTNRETMLALAKSLGADDELLKEIAKASDDAANGQNHLGAATSSTTAIIEGQIKALQAQRRELDLQAQFRNDIIRGNVQDITERMGLKGQAAINEFKSRISPNAPRYGTAAGGFAPNPLATAVNKQRQVEQGEKDLGELINPSKSGGGGRGGAGAAKSDLNASLELLKILETATKRSVDIRLNDERYYYESGKLARADYTQAQIRLENEAFSNSMRVAREELKTVEDSKVKGKDREVALAKANDKIDELEQRHNARLKEYRRQANQEREAAESASWARSLSLTEEVNSGFEELYRRLAERGVASFTDAGTVIAARQREIFIATLAQAKTSLNEFLSKGGDVNTERYRNLFSAIELDEQKLANFDSKTLLDGQDNRQRDLERRKQWADSVRLIYQTIEDMERDTESQRLQMLEKFGVSRQALALKQAQFDLQQEQLESKRKVDDLQRQRDSIEQSLINEQYKAQMIAAIDAEIEAARTHSLAKQAQIQEQYYRDEEKRLKEQAGKIIGVLEKAINGLKSDGWKGFFKSLLGDLDNFLEQAALKVAKARLFKLLEQLHPIAPLSGTQSGSTTAPSTSGAGAGTSIWDWIRGIAGGSLSQQISQQAQTPSGSITQAGREMTGAIKQAGAESKTGVDGAGKAQAGALTTVGQGIISTMLSIASVIANSNARGGFWSGLFTAAAIGAVNGAAGALTGASGSVSSPNGGKGGAKTPGGETQPMKAMGGLLSGPGTGTSDSILAFNRGTGRPGAWFSNGEFIMNAEATRRNRPLLEFINSFGYLPARADGGIIDDSFIRPIQTSYRSGSSSGSNSPQSVQHHYHFDIHAKDADSIYKSKRQIQRQLVAAVREGAQH